MKGGFMPMLTRVAGMFANVDQVHSPRVGAAYASSGGDRDAAEIPCAYIYDHAELLPTYKYIIVGGGSAGCLLAKRLSMMETVEEGGGGKQSRRRRASVLLVENGADGARDVPWISIPAGYLASIGNDKVDYMLQTMKEPHMQSRVMRYPRGKILGGCSAINGMLYVRGQRSDYERRWSAIASGKVKINDARDHTVFDSYTPEPSALWSWENCLERFKRHERHWSGGTDNDSVSTGGGSVNAFHGASGEMHVQPIKYRGWEVLDHFKDAAIKSGIPETHDFNCGSNEGVGYYEVTQNSGTRFTSADAFLPHVIGTSEEAERWSTRKTKRKEEEESCLHIVPRTKCLRLEIGKNGVCDGVVLRTHKGGGVVVTKVNVSGEVVLSAGAVHTPQILTLSGVGSSEESLKKIGITPVVDPIPGIGRNLQDHLQIRMSFRVQNTKTLNGIYHSWFGCQQALGSYMKDKSGPLSMAPSQLGIFTSTSGAGKGSHLPRKREDEEEERKRDPNIQFHVQPLSLRAFGEDLDPYEAMTASVANLNPTSRGSVEVISPDPDTAPQLQFNYLSTEEDVQVAKESVELARCIASCTTSSFVKELSPEEAVPGASVDPITASRAVGTTIFHPCGTCAMGSVNTDPNAVVCGKTFLVKGLRNVRVADASVMPTIASGNLAAPTMMIAETCAEVMMR